jgi:hypothetical protein
LGLCGHNLADIFGLTKNAMFAYPTGCHKISPKPQKHSDYVAKRSNTYDYNDTLISSPQKALIFVGHCSRKVRGKVKMCTE